MLLDDIATALQTALVGTIGTNLFKGYKPDKPDNLVALFEYAGEPPQPVFSGTQLERPGLNVWIRNKEYTAGREKADAVFQALQMKNVGSKNILIKAVQSPQGMGKDQNGRHEWVINFIVIKEVG